jgi:SAM-dependent methyltransferase
MDKRNYFNQLAPRWDSLPSPPGAPDKIRRFVARAIPEDARRVLDAGCGTGVLLPAILDQRPGIELLCELDFAEQMLRLGRCRSSNRAVAAVAADLVRPPLREEVFDAVLCFGIIPHLADPAAACRELIRRLRRGGRLAVGHLMASHELNAFHSQLDGPVSSDRLPPAGDLAALLAACGATPLAAEETPGWYFVLAGRP